MTGYRNHTDTMGTLLGIDVSVDGEIPFFILKRIHKI